jgi:hypothetical protein
MATKTPPPQPHPDKVTPRLSGLNVHRLKVASIVALGVVVAVATLSACHQESRSVETTATTPAPAAPSGDVSGTVAQEAQSWQRTVVGPLTVIMPESTVVKTETSPVVRTAGDMITARGRVGDVEYVVISKVKIAPNQDGGRLQARQVVSAQFGHFGAAADVAARLSDAIDRHAVPPLFPVELSNQGEGDLQHGTLKMRYQLGQLGDDIVIVVAVAPTPTFTTESRHQIESFFDSLAPAAGH